MNLKEVIKTLEIARAEVEFNDGGLNNELV